jgi:hypothetical protein
LTYLSVHSTFSQALLHASRDTTWLYCWKWPGDMTDEDWSQDMIWIHSKTVYLLNCRTDYCTGFNHITALHLLSLLDLIET